MDVAVIGGGIGGLNLALQLERAGIDCRVYESVPAYTAPRKHRRLKLTAGAPRAKPGPDRARIWSTAAQDGAERELARQAEIAYHTWSLSGRQRISDGCGRGTRRASRGPSEGKAWQTPKPQGLCFASSIPRTRADLAREPPTVEPIDVIGGLLSGLVSGQYAGARFKATKPPNQVVQALALIGIALRCEI
jgi:glycine/D-amino acid oxidase-like deaminating enzyme